MFCICGNGHLPISSISPLLPDQSFFYLLAVDRESLGHCGCPKPSFNPRTNSQVIHLCVMKSHEFGLDNTLNNQILDCPSNKRRKGSKAGLGCPRVSWHGYGDRYRLDLRTRVPAPISLAVRTLPTLPDRTQRPSVPAWRLPGSYNRRLR
jgi:hypothetical protein